MKMKDIEDEENAKKNLLNWSIVHHPKIMYSEKLHEIDYVLKLEDAIKRHSALQEKVGDGYESLIQLNKKTIQQYRTDYEITDEQLERRRIERAKMKKKRKKSENTRETFGGISILLSILSFVFFSPLAAILPILNLLFAFSIVEYALFYHIGWLLPSIAIVLGILGIIKEKPRGRAIAGVVFGVIGLLIVFVVGTLLIKFFPLIMLAMLFSEYHLSNRFIWCTTHVIIIAIAIVIGGMWFKK